MKARIGLYLALFFAPGCRLELGGFLARDSAADEFPDSTETVIPDDGQCPSGLTLCGEVCTDTATDPLSCGECGIVCPPGLNADPACAGGACGLQCKPGWSDIDGEPGCEYPCETSSAEEACNGIDDNCDGRIDESFACVAGREVECETPCGTTGTGLCTAGCEIPLPESCNPPEETCNGIDDDCDGECDEPEECCSLMSAPCAVESMDLPGTAACRADCHWDGPCSVKWLRVAAGNSFTCAVAYNGSLWCWGDNLYGQLGDGTMTDRRSPVQVGSDADWEEIQAGGYHACGIRAAGTLFCWGSNSNGQIGNASYSTARSPVQIGVPGEWLKLELGGYHTCGIKNDGSLWCWGLNGEGQLGDGSFIQKNTPVPVASAGPWSDVAAGWHHTCALDGSGGLFCWGFNAFGQLGDGTNVRKNLPTPVGSFSGNADGIAAGDYFTCAVGTDGTLWCWGDNSFGQLGTGNTVQRQSPVQVGTGNDWRSAAGGSLHICAVKTTGYLWCWGQNLWGQLGDGTTDDAHLPVEAAGGASDWATPALGGIHTCALKTGGTLFCWGRNADGQIGDSTSNDRREPVQVGL